MNLKWVRTNDNKTKIEVITKMCKRCRLKLMILLKLSMARNVGL